MAVDPRFAGREYPPTDVYEVGREKIRDFADVPVRRMGGTEGVGEVSDLLPADLVGLGRRVLAARVLRVDRHVAPSLGQRVSRCSVCLPSRGQNFFISRRSGLLRRFFLVM